MAQGQQPQMSASDLAKLADLYKKIDGLTESAAKNAADFANQQGRAAKELARLEKEWSDLTKNIDGTRVAFANIVDEIKGMSSGIGKATTAFKGLESLAAKLQYHQSGINRLSAKELEDLKKKTQQKLKDLELAAKIEKAELARLLLKKRRQGLDDDETAKLEQVKTSIQNINQQISEGANAYKDFNYQLDHNIDVQKQIEKSLGVTGALLKGISKIPFLGDLPGMKDILGEVEEEIRKIEEDEKRIVGKSEAMKMAFKKMGPVLKEGLTDPLLISGFLFTKMIEGFKSLDKAQTEFTRETGRNVSLMDTLNTKLITSSDYIKVASALTKEMGVHADAIFDKETLTEATEMVELMGMSNEQMASLVKYSKFSNTNLKENNKAIIEQLNNFNKVNKTGITGGHIFKEISKVSSSIALSLGGNPQKIANAVAEAKKLGLSLEQVNKTADALLNFEDSISAELEAELLTGKDINLEQARLLALNNDMVGLTKEIGSNQEIINSFLTGNRIQQNAIGQALGMSREEISQMIFDQRMVNGLSDEQLEKITGMSAEDMKRLEVQESINKSLSKMGEILAGPLQTLTSMLDNAWVLYTVFGLIAGVITAQMVVGMISLGKQLITSIPRLATILGLETGIAAAQISGAMAATVGLGAIAILGAIAAGVGALMSSVGEAKQYKDGAIDPSGGMVLSKPKGGIVAQFDKQDYIVGTTNRPGNSGGGSSSIDYAKLAEAMSNINVNPVVKMNDKVLTDEVNRTNNQTVVKTQ